VVAWETKYVRFLSSILESIDKKAPSILENSVNFIKSRSIMHQKELFLQHFPNKKFAGDAYPLKP